MAAKFKLGDAVVPTELMPRKFLKNWPKSKKTRKFLPLTIRDFYDGSDGHSRTRIMYVPTKFDEGFYSYELRHKIR